MLWAKGKRQKAKGALANFKYIPHQIEKRYIKLGRAKTAYFFGDKPGF